MKNYTQFIGEAKTSKNELIKLWFNAIRLNNIEIIKNMCNTDFDINIKNNTGLESNALILTKSQEILDLLLSQPNIDVNAKNIWNETKLIRLAQEYFTQPEVSINNIRTLLLRPEIEVDNIDNKKNWNFVNYLYKKVWLRDYVLQKKIINNNRPDIILFFNQYKLVHPKIKKEYPHLFTGADLNLL